MRKHVKQVGFVSPDLNRTHPVARFGRALLGRPVAITWLCLVLLCRQGDQCSSCAGLDRSKFEVHVYNSKDLSEKKDMSDMVDKWLDIWKMTGPQAAAAIMADQVVHVFCAHGGLHGCFVVCLRLFDNL